MAKHHIGYRNMILFALKLVDGVANQQTVKE